MENIRIFYLNISIFLVVKFSIYLNRRVFVMVVIHNRPVQSGLWVTDCARLVFGHTVRMSVSFWLTFVACVVWHGWRHMLPESFQHCSGDVYFPTNESRFTLYRQDGRLCIYRRRLERFADTCIVKRDRLGRGVSVMVWRGISYGVKSQLIVIAGNLTAVRYSD